MLGQESIGLILTVGAALAGGLLLWRFLRKSPDAAAIERRRRLAVNGRGRLAHGDVLEFDGASVVYAYSVAGAGYTAAQDVLPLEALLPRNRMSMIGPALVKYDPRNPANSIVVCEAWSGLCPGGESAVFPREAR